jgi:heme/copper-type cytochrome/quinol oxidase subunit 3
MAEMSSAGSAVPAGLSREQEEAAYYHEAALNTTWTGTRLMIGIVASGLGAFVFAFFYLRSLNSHGLWYPSGAHATKPSVGVGTTIMVLVVVSAVLATAGLQQIKAGKRGAWLRAAGVALVLGAAAAAVQIWQLTSLSFQPGGSGFASVFVGASPVLALLVLSTMIWLEILLVRARQIPEISFVEQPPTFVEAAVVQRFQASLSAFTLFWSFIAVAAVVLWVLFYLVH